MIYRNGSVCFKLKDLYQRALDSENNLFTSFHFSRTALPLFSFISLLLPSVSLLAPKEICFKPSVSMCNTCLLQSVERRERACGDTIDLLQDQIVPLLVLPLLLPSSIQMLELHKSGTIGTSGIKRTSWWLLSRRN